MGWLADAMNRPKLLAMCMLVAASSILLLIWGTGLWPLWLFTILFTVIDASFPIVWATIGDFFGRKSFATIRGTMAFFTYTSQERRFAIQSSPARSMTTAKVTSQLYRGDSAFFFAGRCSNPLMIKPWDNIRLSVSRSQGPALTR
jgi:MFS family permease